MIKNKFVGEAYSIDPKELKLDPNIASFNPPKTIENYNSLKQQISDYGQTKPVYVRKDRVGDGAHRLQIMKELNRNVLAINVNPDMSDDEYILLCNEDTMTGRNDSTTMLAIKAYMLTTKFSYTDVKAIEMVGLKKGSKAVGHARTIEASQYNKNRNILAALLKGESVCIDGKHTKSLDTARRLINKIEEEELVKNIEIVESDVNYNEEIEMETARDIFWRIFPSEREYSSKVPVDAKREVIALLNTIYNRKELEKKLLQGKQDGK